MTYEGADAVFNVSSYSGALLLQAGARKADCGFATTKRGAARGRGCIMHAAPHNYRVAGKLYDRAHTWRVLIFSLFLSLPNELGNRDGDGKRPEEMDPPEAEIGRESERYSARRKGERLRSRVAQRRECRDSAARSPLVRFYRFLSEPPGSVRAILSPARLVRLGIASNLPLHFFCFLSSLSSFHPCTQYTAEFWY